MQSLSFENRNYVKNVMQKVKMISRDQFKDVFKENIARSRDQEHQTARCCKRNGVCAKNWYHSKHPNFINKPVTIITKTC